MTAPISTRGGARGVARGVARGGRFPIVVLAALTAVVVVVAGITGLGWIGVTAPASAAAATTDHGTSIVHNVTIHHGTTIDRNIDRTDRTHRTDRGFDPRLIISDYNFFNAHAMSERDIQSFLESLSCRPKDTSPCLWEYHQDTVSQPAQGAGHCAAYPGEAHERASRIIAKVAEACGISPRVLLVLLQKEQSLITRPGASGYVRATGYGCPDTAACDTKYFGFFNQVYNAAWQFRQYTQEPVRDYHVGTVDVGYNPDAACGSTRVRILNQATANLYNYTPYQPNAAALANVARDGDGCSAYGNLNFWILYNRWFGPPDMVPYPAFFDPCLNLVGGQPCRPTGQLVPSLLGGSVRAVVLDRHPRSECRLPEPARDQQPNHPLPVSGPRLQQFEHPVIVHRRPNQCPADKGSQVIVTDTDVVGGAV
jgi:hypothetical protein